MYRNGGTLYIGVGTLTLSNSSFKFNSADNDEGALYFEQTSARILRIIMFSNNRADRDGGIMYIKGAAITINNCLIYNNSAGHDGRLLHCLQCH